MKLGTVRVLVIPKTLCTAARARTLFIRCVPLGSKERKNLNSPLTFFCLTDALAAVMAAFLVFCDIIRPKPKQLKLNLVKNNNYCYERRHSLLTTGKNGTI